ncbi:MAG TPA: mercuric transporter MerT family protein [Hyphomicrobiaceae bacterium]|nr:mercuric transporter MerT family protein [Hyphomicrobiaceae bacterium]
MEKARSTHTSEADATKAGLAAAGSIFGALAASSCCILPLVFVWLGVSGAWIGNLTALAPYKPAFVAATLGLLGYGYYLVYRMPRQACAPDEACARPLPHRFVRLGLWAATLLIIVAIGFDYIAPLLSS